MNDSEIDFAAALKNHFPDLKEGIDEGSVTLECPHFSLRFSVGEDAFFVHAIKVFDFGVGIGSTVVRTIKEFSAEKFLSEIVLKKVIKSAVPFWELHGFEVADGDEDDYFYTLE